MFLKGKRPIDVAISLKTDKDETTKLWKEYLQLTGEHKLLKVRDELKENFERFFRTYNAIKKKGLSLENIEEEI